MLNQNLTIQQVWDKGQIIPGYNPHLWRRDACGAAIKATEYGNRDSEYGWEIDHIIPESRGGSDLLSNLRPLHWENNMSKSDGQLVCVVPHKRF